MYRSYINGSFNSRESEQMAEVLMQHINIATLILYVFVSKILNNNPVMFKIEHDDCSFNVHSSKCFIFYQTNSQVIYFSVSINIQIYITR